MNLVHHTRANFFSTQFNCLHRVRRSTTLLRICTSRAQLLEQVSIAP